MIPIAIATKSNMTCGSFNLLYVLLNLINEGFCWFKCRNVVLWNNDGRILGNDSSSFLSAFLHDETSKSSQINVVSFRKGTFYRGHEGFNRVLYL